MITIQKNQTETEVHRMMQPVLLPVAKRRKRKRQKVVSEDYTANSSRGGGGGGSRYVGICPGENLPVFKLQRLECLVKVIVAWDS